MTFNVVPPSEVGRGVVTATCVVVARPEPKAAAMDSVASAGKKFAAETTAAGNLLVIVKNTGGEVPPPGDTSKTVMRAVPGVAMSAAEICAVTCVLLIKVVGRLSPFQPTLDLVVNPSPLNVAFEL